jgi:endonuclease III
MSIREVSRRLSVDHGDPRLHNKRDPLDELVFIILSAKTSEPSYLRTYRALKRAFPSWFEILDSPKGSIARLIIKGGLSKKKELQLRQLLTELRDRGTDDLNGLRKLTNAQAEKFLVSLPGVGLKTARCVLMFSFSRNVFPVDTHVNRVLSRIGLIQPKRLTDRVQDDIQRIIPLDLRHKLHVNLVAHGRAVCKAKNPACESCRVNDMCKYWSITKGTSENELPES